MLCSLCVRQLTIILITGVECFVHSLTLPKPLTGSYIQASSLSSLNAAQRSALWIFLSTGTVSYIAKSDGTVFMAIGFQSLLVCVRAESCPRTYTISKSINSLAYCSHLASVATSEMFLLQHCFMPMTCASCHLRSEVSKDS